MRKLFSEKNSFSPTTA